jgi:hypothetical protein
VLDDVRLSVKPEWPCGFAMPELPGESCEMRDDFPSLGGSLALARTSAGEVCALATASPAQGAPATQLTAWQIVDGARFQPAAPSDAPPVELPEGVELVGAGIASDDNGWHVVVAYREGDRVRLGFADGPECGRWGALTESRTLFTDAEAPSYVAIAGQHEVYFSRKPTGSRKRALWGLLRDRPEAEPVFLAELPDQVEAPVSVQAVGTRDRVLAYPVAGAASGIGLLVADEILANWEETGTRPILEMPFRLDLYQGSLAFDDRGVASAALTFSTDGGFLLYAGRTTVPGLEMNRDEQSRLTVGTAWFTPAALTLPEAASGVEPACGDGECGAGEGCTSCESDCGCRGVELVRDATAAGSNWEVRSSDADPRAIHYLVSEPPGLNWAGGEPTWSVLPLERAVGADFELSFDAYLSGFDQSLNTCTLYVGLGADPPPESNTPASKAGIFTSFARDEGCWLVQNALPFVVSQGMPASGAIQTLGAAPACEEELLDSWRHVVLRREGSRVSVRVPRSDGCGFIERSLEYSGALPRLDSIQIGAGSDPFAPCEPLSLSGKIANLKLRLIEDDRACPAGQERCGGDEAWPACVDTTVSNEHCGACENSCSNLETCRGGACRCADLPGVVSCDGLCVDTRTTLEHCGACGHRCEDHCFNAVCDGSIGNCAFPLELPVDGGRLTLDPAELGGEPSVLCGLFVPERLIVEWRPARSGQVRIDAGLLAVIGFVEADSCDRFPTCNLDLDAVEPTIEALVQTVTAGRIYRIAIALLNGGTATLSAEFL